MHRITTTFPNSLAPRRAVYQNILNYSARVLVTYGIEFLKVHMDPTISQHVGSSTSRWISLWDGRVRQGTHWIEPIEWRVLRLAQFSPPCILCPISQIVATFDFKSFVWIMSIGLLFVVKIFGGGDLPPVTVAAIYEDKANQLADFALFLDKALATWVPEW
jgi:hypothetical protein